MKAQLLGASALLLVLAGCGTETDPSAGSEGKDPAVSESPEPQAPDLGERAVATSNPWLVRFEVAKGQDEVSTVATYLSVTPDTGESTATTLPVPITDFASDPYLLVSGDRKWAIAANQLTPEETASGKLTVHSLVGEEDVTIDVRDSDPPTIGWAFAPEELATIHTLDKAGDIQFQLFTDGEVAEMSDNEPDLTGKEVVPVFDGTSGFPVLRDKKTGKLEAHDSYTPPNGKAGDPEQVPCTENDENRPTASFVDPNGVTTAVCVQGSDLVFKQLAAGSSTWEDIGTPAKGVVPKGTENIAFLLP